MLRIRYLLTTALLLVFALWVIQCYRSSVLDPDFLLYGQSVTLGPGRGPVRNPAPFPAITRQNQDGIALERMRCEGSCPWYLLEIDSSGAVSFTQNRDEGRKSTITTDQFRDLVGRFEAIHFFELNDLYHPTGTDIPPVHIRLTVNGKTKSITHSDITPPGLEELERTIERATNTHLTRWLEEHLLFPAIGLLLALPAVFGDPARGLPRKILGNRGLAWVGLVSYGIFLWHQPLIQPLTDHGALDLIPGHVELGRQLFEQA